MKKNKEYKHEDIMWELLKIENLGVVQYRTVKKGRHGYFCQVNGLKILLETLNPTWYIRKYFIRVNGVYLNARQKQIKEFRKRVILKYDDQQYRSRKNKEVGIRKQLNLIRYEDKKTTKV